MAHDKSTNQSRRRFLTVAGGTLVGMTAVGAAQQMNDQQAAETLQLGGRVQGWQGQSPNSIKGQKNPTLKLQSGQVYQVTWTNLDGQPHDFALRNSDGKNLAVIFPNVQTNTNGGSGGGSGSSGGGNMGGSGGGASPPKNAISKTQIVQKKGASQTLQFVATKDIEHYVCTVHPTTMVGRVETSSESGSGGSGDHMGGNGDHSGGSGDHSGGSGDHTSGNHDHSGSNTDHSGNGE